MKTLTQLRLEGLVRNVKLPTGWLAEVSLDWNTDGYLFTVWRPDGEPLRTVVLDVVAKRWGQADVDALFARVAA